MYERLADRVGRQIRYGLQPDRDAQIELQEETIDAKSVVLRLHQVSEQICEVEEKNLEFDNSELTLFADTLGAAAANAATGVTLIPQESLGWKLVVYDRRMGLVNNRLEVSFNQAWIQS